MQALPLVATNGAFQTIFRFYPTSECACPSELTLPEGDYQITTAAGRQLGTVGLKNRRVSITKSDREMFRAAVVGARTIEALTGSLPEEFMTTADRLAVLLDTWEEAAIIIDGRIPPPRSHPNEHMRHIHQLGRDKLLRMVDVMLTKSIERDDEQMIRDLLEDPTPEILVRAGWLRKDQLVRQLTRLSALLAWQPTEPPAPSPAP